MIFTQFPNNYASLYQPLIYAFEDQEPPRTLDVEIMDAPSGKILAAKRLYRTSSGEIDIAPILQRMVQFQPTTNLTTGFELAAKRSMTISLRIGADASVARTFLASEQLLEPSVLHTTLPLERLIARGEADELTLMSGVGIVEVTALTGSLVDHRGFLPPTNQPFPHVFRLCTTDFGKADTITVALYTAVGGTLLAKIRYTLTDPMVEGVRIAWVSRVGSLEHYTFPLRHALEEVQGRQIAATTAGLMATTTTHEQRLTICSAYEPQALLRALVEIGSAQQIWQATARGYTAVEIVPESHTICCYGALKALQFTLRPTTSNAVLWN
ncbi:MAG: hypothetical protein RR330_03135 [Alistipes sp.]